MDDDSQMVDAIGYLQKYMDHPEILPLNCVDPEELALLPGWWREALELAGAERVARVLREWERVESFLPGVVEVLKRNLRGVALLRNRTSSVRGWKSSVRLLYKVMVGDDTAYYAGGNPLQKGMGDAVKARWGLIPTAIRNFYDTFHNGWYYVASESMGLAPTENLFFLDELEWGILEEIDDPGCKLDDLLAVYTNGMGGYVALNLGDRRDCGDLFGGRTKHRANTLTPRR